MKENVILIISFSTLAKKSDIKCIKCDFWQNVSWFEAQNPHVRDEHIATSRLAFRWMRGSPRTEYARRTTQYICGANKQQ